MKLNHCNTVRILIEMLKKVKEIDLTNFYQKIDKVNNNIDKIKNQLEQYHIRRYCPKHLIVLDELDDEVILFYND